MAGGWPVDRDGDDGQMTASVGRVDGDSAGEKWTLRRVGSA